MSKKGVLRTYKSYLFRDKDPVIDAVRTAIADSKMRHSKISEASNVSANTISNWLGGRTKRPQFCTVMAVAFACGKRGVHKSANGVKFTD